MAGKPTALSPQQIAENQRKALNLRKLRKRSQLSMDELAKAMGYRGQSSIQRYLSPDYDLGFRPEIVARFRKALLGKGDPPITERDLQFFGDSTFFNPGESKFFDTELVRNYTTIPAELNIVRVTLPLREGSAVLEMPAILSPSSMQAFKTWLNLMIDLSQERFDSMISQTNRRSDDEGKK